MTTPSEARIAVLLSGGLDSAILTGELLRREREVVPIYVRTDLHWQSPEEQAADRYCRALASPRLASLVKLDMPLRDLYGDHWSVSGRAVPNATSPDEAVYLPGRNALLLVKALVWCQLNSVSSIALAPLGTSPFADARDEFFNEFESALNRGAPRGVKIVRPFVGRDKAYVMRLGLGLPLETTFSCIDPQAGRHCGRCNKCAERQGAFPLIGAIDPTDYDG